MPARAEGERRSGRTSASGAGGETVAACLPPRDCGRCPRLADFLRRQREAHPDWFNAPVPPFGPEDARLAIIGLAPGLRGANRTGRPFTGDYAGELLYGMLVSLGLARGHYEARPDDGLELVDTVIINAVRCVPPQNKPTPAEIAACNTFLACEMERRPLRVIVALGRVAHDAVLMAHGLVRARYPFAHGAQHPLPGGRVLIDSYHCSRYNTQTGRLTPAMFAAVLRQARQRLEA